MTKNNLTKNFISDNKGFSLVELIICVAILGIAVVPLMKAFSLAAITNGKAASVQNATSTAEDVMEEIKGLTIEQLKDMYSTTDGTSKEPTFFAKNDMTPDEITARDSYLNTKIASGSEGVVIKEKDDFYVLYKPSVTINSEAYNVVATIDSTVNTADAEYSNSSSSSSSSTGISKADDANVVELPVLERINTGENVAISTEFNKYDESAIARLIDLYYDEKPTEVEIDDATGKIVTTSLTLSDKKKSTLIDVYVAGTSPNNTYKITATTTYSVKINGVPKEFSKVIYTNFFKDNEPKLYLFYKTMNEYLDMEYQAGDSDTTGKGKLSEKMASGSVYRIDDEELLFNTNDSSKLQEAYVMLDKYYGLNGSAYQYDLIGKDTDGLFDSNIKTESRRGNITITPAGKVDLKTYIDGKDVHVYSAESGTYIYKINVILTKDDGKVYAFLTSNKPADR